MKKHIVLKSLILILSWLILSPLFLIFVGRWKLFPKWLRLVLFVLSPLMVVVIILAVVFANYAAVNHFHRYHFTKPRALERITGVAFPKYEVMEYNQYGGGHGPGYYDTGLEFNDLPDEAFYKVLEKKGVIFIAEDDSVRSFTFRKPYRYLSIGYYDLITYGDAIVEIKEGSKSFKVTLFEWPDNNALIRGDYDDDFDEFEDAKAKVSAFLSAPCGVDQTDSLTVYHPSFSRVDLVTGTMPDKTADSNVVFCCAASFTGECLAEFKHTNIAGDHVSSGERYRGFRCKRNTGAFVWYENGWKFLWKEYSHELDSAAKHKGMGFGQEMIIHQGKLCETIRKDGNVNQFRALCEVDGQVCVIDGKMAMAFGAFKKQLVAYGVKEALYLDMGPGWNHSWYRDEDGNAVDIFPYLHPYCTNWVTFYR